MVKDEVFKEPKIIFTDFKFDKKVVTVFDDLIIRSVPCYLEIQRMIAELASEYAIKNTLVYDLGCSMGTTLVNMNGTVSKDIKFIGIDNSPQMLEQSKSNMMKIGFQREFELLNFDLNKGVPINNAPVAVLCLTLQFTGHCIGLKFLKKFIKE